MNTLTLRELEERGVDTNPFTNIPNIFERGERIGHVDEECPHLEHAEAVSERHLQGDDSHCPECWGRDPNSALFQICYQISKTVTLEKLARRGVAEGALGKGLPDIVVVLQGLTSNEHVEAWTGKIRAYVQEELIAAAKNLEHEKVRAACNEHGLSHGTTRDRLVTMPVEAMALGARQLPRTALEVLGAHLTRIEGGVLVFRMPLPHSKWMKEILERTSPFLRHSIQAVLLHDDPPEVLETALRLYELDSPGPFGKLENCLEAARNLGAGTTPQR